MGEHGTLTWSSNAPHSAVLRCIVQAVSMGTRIWRFLTRAGLVW
jgi:hypothetical protein